MAINLFAYGTLLLPEVMRSVAGEALPSRRVCIEGYERFCIGAELYPGLFRTGRGQTEAIVYEGIGQEVFTRIKFFEDDFNQIEEVEVRLEDGGTIKAVTFSVPPHEADILSHEPWRLEDFKKLHLTSYLEACSTHMARYSGNAPNDIINELY